MRHDWMAMAVQYDGRTTSDRVRNMYFASLHRGRVRYHNHMLLNDFNLDAVVELNSFTIRALAFQASSNRLLTGFLASALNIREPPSWRRDLSKLSIDGGRCLRSRTWAQTSAVSNLGSLCPHDNRHNAGMRPRHLRCWNVLK
jgi:hypothetical protein